MTNAGIVLLLITVVWGGVVVGLLCRGNDEA